MKTYCKVLTIAGSDPGGGAGIQADLKTFAALECYGLTAVTAITAQNTMGVQSVFPIPARVVAQQLKAIFCDIEVDAIKIGMLSDEEIIEAVVSKLLEQPRPPVVLDPVMIAKGGCCLLKPTAMGSFKKLIPYATLITPNLQEASELLGYPVRRKEQMEKAAMELLDLGADHVLLKGGHLTEGQGSDCLCTNKREIQWFHLPAVKTRNTHGTGCTLSSAIASFLAKKYPLENAIEQGKYFLQAALEAGSEYSLGLGCGPLNPFFSFWREPCGR